MAEISKGLTVFLEYPEVSKWMTRVMQRTNSAGTKQIYLYHLKYFTDYSGKTPSQIVKTPIEQIEDLMYEYDAKLMERKLSSKYRSLAWNTLRSFLKANRIIN